MYRQSETRAGNHRRRTRTIGRCNILLRECCAEWCARVLSSMLAITRSCQDGECLQVLVQEQPKQWYHFLTTLCAIIGGVFTVCGILDSISFSAVKMMKKVELGKQG